MTFSQSINSVFAKYATFDGRASRSEFWYFALFQFIVSAIFGILGALFSTSTGQMPLWVQILSGLYSLATILPSLAVAVRRMHDIGKGGGWIFISLVPIIGTIWFIVLAVTPGQPMPNRFGPQPE